MPDFDTSLWADSSFSEKYRDEADAYLPLRHLFIETTKSLYVDVNADNSAVKVLDLGCGDGLIAAELCDSFSPALVTLVDGSAEMLGAARKRLRNCVKTGFVQSSFQDLIEGVVEVSPGEKYDFIFSSLAIHHLSFGEKQELFLWIYNRLSDNGTFIHYDVVASPSDNIEKWYLQLWKQWIKKHPETETGSKLLDIPEQYKANPDNRPDTLKVQMDTMEKIGFKDVDCYLKWGIFALFGGRK